MSILSVGREGCVVTLTLDTGVRADDGKTWTIPFEWTYHSDLCAQLLERCLRNHLAATVVAARREAYNEGYKDGRAKRGKRVPLGCDL